MSGVKCTKREIKYMELNDLVKTFGCNILRPHDNEFAQNYKEQDIRHCFSSKSEASIYISEVK